MFARIFGSPTTPPFLLKYRSSKTFIILTVATAIFTDIFLYDIVVPVLPFALKSRAGVQPDVTQKWISVFLAVYGAGLLTTAPICGWAADRTSSRRMPMIAGLLALAGATVILCVGTSIAVLAVGRALQGISAAVSWVVGLALLVDTCGPEGVGQAMGYVSLSLSLGLLVGPLLGGIVFANAGYYAVFAMAFGLIAFDIFMRVFLIEKKVAVQWLPSEVTETTPAESHAQEEKRDTTKEIELEAVSPIEIREDDSKDRPIAERVATSVSARSAAEEILPENAPAILKHWTARLPPILGLLASRRVLSAIWGCMMQATLFTAFDTILPLYVRDTFHWDSTGAGLIFLPMVVVSFVGPVFGQLSDKYGPRWFAVAGYVLAAPFLILMRLVTKDTLDQKVLLCALLALFGLCLTMMITPMMAEIAYAVDAKAQRRPPGFFGKNGAYAQAYSLYNMAWAGGCLIGPLLAGLVTQAHGWSVATLILGCVSLFTAIPTAIWTGGSIFKKLRRKKEERQAMSNEPVHNADA